MGIHTIEIYPSEDITKQWKYTYPYASSNHWELVATSGNTKFIYTDSYDALLSTTCNDIYKTVITGTQPEGNISLTIYMTIKKDSEEIGTCNIKPLIKYSGQVIASGNTTITTSWKTYSFTFNQNPITNTSWASGDFSYPDFGIGVRLLQNDQNNVYLSQLYGVITYSDKESIKTFLKATNSTGSISLVGIDGSIIMS